ncbi:rRNA methylase [Spongiibacter sp. IMCC21906]|uniref:TrmH family RNA methyltransferase n=1 Tax=Spongiibacter sp. IMCC21906 TaxID=1620392 RepID=UPI00062DE040|nr:RNA methyltransferase [Spongiibacter sp. IMCC21906]AKH69745.1 rRNA methylase [Spongiibacter sp. IMCC21906]
MSDSENYQQRKAFFAQMLTIYGRKPVLEALQDDAIAVYKLHLASSNREDGQIRKMRELAEKRGVIIEMHDRQALSRISKNGKQDQGAAADLQLSGLKDASELSQQTATGQRQFIALDRITNPQNLGMIIRSVAASGIDGLILPRKGCAALSPLVIKSSAGTLFRAPIFLCDDLSSCLSKLKNDGTRLCALSSHAKQSLLTDNYQGSSVYVLGNETDGVSPAISKLCQQQLSIPMHNGVESLNVAITAALIAFSSAGN